MRGVPGSGKSTKAVELAGATGVIHSTDTYFYVNGKYVFDPHKLTEYHDKNYEAFCDSLSQGISPVICDNTNSRRSDFVRYADCAQKMGYTVKEIILPHPDVDEATKRNIHAVPASTIQKMIEQWEK